MAPIQYSRAFRYSYLIVTTTGYQVWICSYKILILGVIISSTLGYSERMYNNYMFIEILIVSKFLNCTVYMNKHLTSYFCI